MKNILISVCGSISAYKSYDLIRSLVKKGYNVKCSASEGGSEFLNYTTLQALLNSEVYDDIFEMYDMKGAIHIKLAEWADTIVVFGATADFMAKAAIGVADDIVLATNLATKSNIICVPAMHTNMWNHPATQANVKTLKSFNYNFVDPIEGTLADGTTGVGHIADQEDILAKIDSL